MEWDLKVSQKAESKSLPFTQLLDKLRSMHEEICTRNTQLELQAMDIRDNSSREANKHELSEPQECVRPPCRACPALTYPFIPKEGERLEVNNGDRRLLCVPEGRTPRQTDSLAPGFEDLRRSIDNIAKKQEYLCQQFTQVFLQPEVDDPVETAEASKTATNSPDPGNGTLSVGFNMRGSKSSKASLPLGERDSFEYAHSKGKSARQQSRFAVPTGLSRELTNGRWSSKWPQAMRGGFNLKNYVQSFLESGIFNVATSVLILTYAGLIAIETNLIAEDPDKDQHLVKICHYGYTAIFTTELALRFLAYGCSALTGDEGFWNKLDVFFVISAIIEVVMENAVGQVSTASSVVRAVRIGRIIRTVRLVRTFHQFHEFQKMAFALLSSMKTLACSLTLLVFVMFFFAVWLTQGAADIEKRQQIKDLELRYGSLTSTTYTLFLSVSNGISWDLCYMPLHRLSWWSAQAFLLYVSITLFGVLNVVTSIFVEGVIRSVQRSKDLIVQEKEEEKKIAIVHMQEVFKHLDSDQSGQISMDELEHFLKEPSLRKYMGALHIEADDTRLLFKLLDRDNSGVISVEEFCEGCMRLKGSARSIDVHALMYQTKNFLDKWGDFTGYVEDSFAHLRRRLPRDSSGSRSSKDSSKSFKRSVPTRSVPLKPASDYWALPEEPLKASSEEEVVTQTWSPTYV